MVSNLLYQCLSWKNKLQKKSTFIIILHLLVYLICKEDIPLYEDICVKITAEEVFSQPFLSFLKETVSSLALHVFVFVGRQYLQFLNKLLFIGYKLTSRNAEMHT